MAKNILDFIMYILCNILSNVGDFTNFEDCTNLKKQQIYNFLWENRATYCYITSFTNCLYDIKDVIFKKYFPQPSCLTVVDFTAK